MNEIDSRSVDLVVTSPPYPMIEMWDETFGLLNPDIADALADEDGRLAFDLMHAELGKTWKEVVRVLKEGAIVCINIGDATRTIGDRFCSYSNHSRTIEWFEEAGLVSLPSIIWRKPTNAPNKFMGSGMLPPGAYVTLEHEHILIFRKGDRRAFDTPEQKRLRNESSFFWEERNQWFSDVWTDLPGTGQSMNGCGVRRRSGAFPFELAYRLVNMYSVKDDLVLDPFLGTGVTVLAAITSRRNSIGYEIDDAMLTVIKDSMDTFEDEANRHIDQRISRHLQFINERKCGSVNEPHGFGCVSNQERAIKFDLVEQVDTRVPTEVTVRYGDRTSHD